MARQQNPVPGLSQDQGPEAAEISPPGFAPVQRWPGPASQDPPHPQAVTMPDAGAGGAGGPGSGSSGSRVPTPTSSLFQATKAKSFSAIAAGAFKALGGLLNGRLGTGEDDECWLPDQDDEDAVAPPLGRLAARHVPIGAEGQDLTDLEDIGAAAIGLIAWALKGMTSMWQARRERRRAQAPLQEAGAVVYQGGPGTGEEDQR